MPGHDYPLKDTPYLQGRRARANGVSRWENPYKLKENTNGAADWLKGWSDRDCELRCDSTI